MIFDELTSTLKNSPGKTAFYYKDLTDGETKSFNADMIFDAASVIKLPVMAAVYNAVKNKELTLSQTLTVKDSQKVPSCGAVKYIPEGTMLPLSSLISMMITISDNTASNMLINLLSIEKINDFLMSLDITDTRINRLLFDAEAASRGISNHITLKDIAKLLEMIDNGTLVDQNASAAMKNILLAQQINHKIPNALSGIRIAHKTGEDTNESHDVSIVYAKHPYILCFASEQTNAYEFECLMRSESLRIYNYTQEKYW